MASYLINTAICTVLVVCGIMADSDVEQRLQYTIKNLEDQKDTRMSLQASLRVLRMATPETLKQPTISLAALVITEKTETLIIEWIESQPTPDTAWMQYGTENGIKQFRIDELDMQWSEESCKTSVLCNMLVPDLNLNSKERLQIINAVKSGKCKVSMVKNGKIISNSIAPKLMCKPSKKGAAK